MPNPAFAGAETHTRHPSRRRGASEGADGGAGAGRRAGGAGGGTDGRAEKLAEWRALGVVMLHAVPGVVIMAGVAAAGHSGVALAASALGLAALSMGYARLARLRVWARDHVVDLWAMALLMLAMLWSGIGAGSGAGTASWIGVGARSHAANGDALGRAIATVTPVGHQHALAVMGSSGVMVVVALWVCIRLVSAIRTGVHAHSVASAVICGGGMVWMLVA